MTPDKQEQEERDQEFEHLLATVERIERESAERAAKSGEKPLRTLVGVDHDNKTIAIVPVDQPGMTESGGQPGDDEDSGSAN